jgi:hypothetical protein
MTNALTNVEGDLSIFARRIVQREITIRSLLAATLERANQTILEIILQGNDLSAAKAIMPHGAWLPWLAAQGIASRSAQRYMAIAANTPHVAHLEKAQSLRDLLAMCELEGAEAKAEPKRWPIYMEGLNRASRFFGYVQRYPLGTWPAEGRTKLKEELRPIVLDLWPEFSPKL